MGSDYVVGLDADAEVVSKKPVSEGEVNIGTNVVDGE